jgi:uncharacterized protein YbbC (DUF1343 family)
MPPVSVGLDVLVRERSSLIQGRRIGLLCHQASVTRDLTHAVDAIGAVPRVRLTALFAPEHGIAGVAQDLIHVASARDRSTGLPVWSLYGRRLAPTREMLDGLDAVVTDRTGRTRSAASTWRATSAIPPTRPSWGSIPCRRGTA